MHKKLTSKLLEKFKKTHVTTPEVITMSQPEKQKAQAGLRDPPLPIEKPGDRVEMDAFTTRYNEKGDKGKTNKMVTYGGATAAYVSVDVYSGFSTCYLVQNQSNVLPIVVQEYMKFVNDGHHMRTFASDLGIVHKNSTVEAENPAYAYLDKKGVEVVISTAGDHNSETPVVEVEIGIIKRKVSMAITYLFTNPNFIKTEFTQKQVLMLWGELTMWAVIVGNC